MGKAAAEEAAEAAEEAAACEFTNQLRSRLRDGLPTLGPGPPPALGVMEGTEPVEPVAMTIPLEAEVKATPLVKLAKTPEEEAPIEPEAALMSG